MARPTIYSVADEAGVSISTVSLVFNRPHKVRAATRDNVVAAAHRLGYRPPARAESSRGQLATVAVAAPFSTVPSCSLRLGGLLSRLANTGTDVVVHDVPAPNLQAAPLLDALPFRGGIDGTVVMGVPLTPAAEERLVQASTPCILVDATSRLLPSVVTDDEHAGRLVGEHLLATGHHRIAFVHDQQRSGDYVSAGMLRLGGLNLGLGTGSDEPDVSLYELPDDDDPMTPRRVVGRVIEAGCTAVFANHDALAARVLGALRALGLTAPADLAVVGCDDGALAQGLDLTTVRQPFADSGKVAAEALLAMLAGGAPVVRTTTLDAPLIIRGTA